MGKASEVIMVTGDAPKPLVAIRVISNVETDFGRWPSGKGCGPVERRRARRRAPPARLPAPFGVASSIAQDRMALFHAKGRPLRLPPLGSRQRVHGIGRRNFPS